MTPEDKAVLPNVSCPACGKAFKLTWMDYVGGSRETLEIELACSDVHKVGSVTVYCPHCEHAEELE